MPIVVSTPSRLHFGLFRASADAVDERQFGGVGAMIARPRVVVRLAEHDGLSADGPHAERVLEFARRWSRFHRRAEPACRLTVLATPPQHVGLGLGTQLGLSVATLLDRFHGLPTATPAELALSVGRGLRSAVGTYGFACGGLISERGKRPGETLSPLDCRVDLPSAWRFLLVRPLAAAGLAGEAETRAFAALPPVADLPQRLADEARLRLLPAAARGDFAAFSASLFDFGYYAGLGFARQQAGGAYNGPRLTQLVERMRSFGAVGVGQSSWGPTLFALCEDETAAERLADRVRDSEGESVVVDITEPDNRGARVE